MCQHTCGGGLNRRPVLCRFLRSLWSRRHKCPDTAHFVPRNFIRKLFGHIIHRSCSFLSVIISSFISFKCNCVIYVFLSEWFTCWNGDLVKAVNWIFWSVAGSDRRSAAPSFWSARGKSDIIGRMFAVGCVSVVTEVACAAVTMLFLFF